MVDPDPGRPTPVRPEPRPDRRRPRRDLRRPRFDYKTGMSPPATPCARS